MRSSRGFPLVLSKSLKILVVRIITALLSEYQTKKILKMSKNSKTSSTSQKHRDFMEPMGSKPVTKLAGIGETLGGRLNDAGYEKASNVLGQYLVMNQDQGRFQGWMNDVSNANSKQSSDCYKCLNDWSKEFL